MNDLVHATDKGHVSALVLLDLSSAFDTVDHRTLASVLDRRFLVKGGALNWFCSYLSDRRQSFHHSGEALANYPVDCSARKAPYSVPSNLSHTPRISSTSSIIMRCGHTSTPMACNFMPVAFLIPETIDNVGLKLKTCVADVAQV